MNNQLIQIKNENGKKTVPAINLHMFLEVESRFNDWIRNRIEKYGFVEGEDFYSILSKSTGGRPRSEYYLSIDMAKELSMVENNEKGQQARRYFIECEKIAKQESQLPTDPKAQALFLAENLLLMQKQLEDQQPAVDFVKAIQANKGSMKIGDFAKVLFDKNKLVIGQQRLFAWLKQKRYLQPDNMPYQKFMNAGYFEVVTGTISNSENGRIWTQTKVTGKGIVYLTEKIVESGDFEVMSWSNYGA